MKFDISKWATLVMERKEGGRRWNTKMPGGIAIGDMGDGAYKYFGVLESDKIKMEEMNLKIRQDYYRRAKRVLESSLNRKAQL